MEMVIKHLIEDMSFMRQRWKDRKVKSMKTCSNLIKSIPGRIQAVIKVIPSTNWLNSDFRRVGQKTVPMSDYFV